MPFTRKGPTRPRRLMSLSSDRRRYSNGGGLFFALFGIVFSTTGLLVLGVCGWNILELFGLVPSAYDHRRSIDEQLLVILGALAIGGGHFAGGTFLLWTLRTTLDRARDLVVVRSGWLGWRRQRRRLNEFQAVTVLPARSFFASSRNDVWFDVALPDASGASLVVGNVSDSHDLALTVADEISQFTHLPATTSHAAGVDFRQARAGA